MSDIVNNYSDVLLTEEFIKLHTKGGLGVKRVQAEVLGLEYPLKSGWFQSIIGKQISSNAAKIFIEAGNPVLKRYIYALALNENKFYIGQTTTTSRLQDHFKGKGSAWTKLYGVESILESYDIGLREYQHAEMIENRKTIEYMNRYGWKNVRGGFWSYCDLEQHRKSLLAHKESLILCDANFMRAFRISCQPPIVDVIVS